MSFHDFSFLTTPNAPNFDFVRSFSAHGMKKSDFDGPTVAKVLSASSPSIHETLQNIAGNGLCGPTSKKSELIGEIDEDTAPSVTLREKSVSSKKLKNENVNRAVSAYPPPSSTPRIPLINFLPGTSSKKQAPEKREIKEKRKSKKHGLFHHRPKSKEKRPHFWIKLNPSDEDHCETCLQVVSHSEAYQCNGCQAVVHSSCKDQFDKTRCAKCSKHKTGAPIMLQHTDSNSDISRQSLPNTSFVISLDAQGHVPPDLAYQKDISCTSDDQENVPEANCSSKLPSGFVAYTIPCQEWDEVQLWVEEPEPWSDTVGKEAKKNLSSREIKRQNTIHDLYITEKHHCQTLVVLKHTYFDALALNSLVPVDQLNRLIPRLDSLLSVHLHFLRLLRRVKLDFVVVDNVHDVLLTQFTGDLAKEMADAYTKFCSQKDAAVRMHNFMLKDNQNFKALILSINSNGFYKALSLTDCLLKITQRLSKYHQFVESLVKNTPTDSPYRENMLNAEKCVKDFITSVDLGIDKIQMQEMRVHVARNTDTKSCIQYDKDSYFTCSILSLRKMIVRDKAGKFGSDGVYLIATFPKPEMYEVKCKTKKENQTLINRIQKAVDNYVFAETAIARTSDIQFEKMSENLPSEISDDDLEKINALFETLKPLNEKLRDYYTNLSDVYGDILSYVKTVATKIKTDDDRLKLIDLFDKGFNAETEFLSNIALVRAMGNATHEAVTDAVADQEPPSNEDVSRADSLSGGCQSVTTTTSTFDSQIGRSNTFHYVRNSDKRKGLRKHATVSGILGVDVRTSAPSCNPFIGLENESMNSVSTEEEAQKKSMTEIFRQVNDSQVLLNELKQENLRLQCEMTFLRRSHAAQKPPEAGRHSVPNDSYSTLEELRRMHASLNQKKQEFNQLVDDKHFDLNRREKLISEREIRLDREDAELRARWMHLHQVWEHHCLSGLPLGFALPSHLPQCPPPSTPMPIYPSSDDNLAVKKEINNNLHRRQASGNGGHPSTCNSPSSDMLTMMEPSIFQRPYSPAPSQFSTDSSVHNCGFGVSVPSAYGGFLGAGTVGPSAMGRSTSASDVPPVLQGSLVHRRGVSSGASFADYRHGHGFTPKTVLPVKLCQATATTTVTDSCESPVVSPDGAGERRNPSLTTRLHSIGRYGSTASKKKTSPVAAQILPSKLSTIGSIGKKK